MKKGVYGEEERETAPAMGIVKMTAYCEKLVKIAMKMAFCFSDAHCTVIMPIAAKSDPKAMP